MADRDSILSALTLVVDPCSIATGTPISLVDMGMVKDVVHDAGDVRVTLTLTSPVCWQAANIISKIEEVVGRLPAVNSVTCLLDAANEWTPDLMSRSARERLERIGASRRH
jgi:metal-sulfur cluster biosynthetic enzyme